ncbi:hypothetical protein BOTBODRAFT_25609 [Botryobasidium botryosum FD-172 SS1]|uniref:Uncharacterized protein n=1 Tax=Botryobasidium botryosum (strain FD-172 SS1) TaxID=930990 RepID=A0A067MZY8_BOTB1|nr:hypothetical protein BOTBODRAFT_25609 [Botryobasidium botryosum FD-172 SS1]
MSLLPSTAKTQVLKPFVFGYALTLAQMCEYAGRHGIEAEQEMHNGVMCLDLDYCHDILEHMVRRTKMKTCRVVSVRMTDEEMAAIVAADPNVPSVYFCLAFGNNFCEAGLQVAKKKKMWPRLRERLGFADEVKPRWYVLDRGDELYYCYEPLPIPVQEDSKGQT